MPVSTDSFTLTGIADLATIVAAAGVVTAIYKGIQARLRASVFSHRDVRWRLNKMACGVGTDYVDSLFGPPPFRFSEGSDKLAESPGTTQLSWRIYQTKHAWLQVIAGFDGSVRAFSITVTDPKFRFRSGHLMFDRLDIQLGTARFGDVDHPPDGWQSLTGARRFSYAESHWVRQPGRLPGVRARL
jgi:hypothetical protein